MPINFNETIQRIKQAGSTGVRSVPMPNQPIDGDYQIEILTEGNWTPLVTGINKKTAEDIISQATNRVILG